jgi:uncharacterized protein YjbJ (UPF0337 family)
MNKEELKGKARNLKGRAKRAVGALTGNKKLEAEGAAEQLAGAGEEKLAQAKEALSADDQLAKDAAEEDAEARAREDSEGPTPTTEDPYPITKH